MLPRSSHVLQCKLGHIVCEECYVRLNVAKQCPQCRGSFNRPATRNFLAEKLLKTIDKRCRYEVMGCRYFAKNSEKLAEHEGLCELRPQATEDLHTNNEKSHNGIIPRMNDVLIVLAWILLAILVNMAAYLMEGATLMWSLDMTQTCFSSSPHITD